uniref:Transmembrane protein n=2 Tax=Ascaris lumbricoides TaxID=6252 RepID=A0A0M3HIS8_ASCLU
MQLLVASQLEWLVRDTFTQGLWAICKFSECHLRDSVISLSVLVMHLLGAVVLLLSALVSLAIVSSKTRIARFGDAKRLGIVANVQFVAGERSVFVSVALKLEICVDGKRKLVMMVIDGLVNVSRRIKRVI